MTLQLILMRHAKSDWGVPNLPDHERSLNRRGREAARGMGRWLRKKGYLPDLVICSDANRTKETNTRLGLASDLEFTRDLYLAEPDEILQVIRRTGPAQSVLVLAHNPGIGTLAQALCDHPAIDPDLERFPTGACAVFDVSAVSWAGLQPGVNRLRDFTIPRRLH